MLRVAIRFGLGVIYVSRLAVSRLQRLRRVRMSAMRKRELANQMRLPLFALGDFARLQRLARVRKSAMRKQEIANQIAWRRIRREGIVMPTNPTTPGDSKPNNMAKNSMAKN